MPAFAATCGCCRKHPQHALGICWLLWENPAFLHCLCFQAASARRVVSDDILLMMCAESETNRKSRSIWHHHNYSSFAPSRARKAAPPVVRGPTPRAEEPLVPFSLPEHPHREENPSVSVTTPGADGSHVHSDTSAGCFTEASIKLES